MLRRGVGVRQDKIDTIIVIGELMASLRVIRSRDIITFWRGGIMAADLCRFPGGMNVDPMNLTYQTVAQGK